MNPAILFTVLLGIAALTLTRLSDKALLRVLALSTVMVGVPSAVLMIFMDWRAALNTPDVAAVTYVLVAVGFVGAIFLAACSLAAVLRVGAQLFRASRQKNQHSA